MTDLLPPGDDFETIAADDALLDAIASGLYAEEAQPVDAMLAAWHAELTAQVLATPATLLLETPASAPVADRHWYRSRRSVAGIAAITLVFAASTGVAAALPGNPVHRTLFGSDAAPEDTVQRVVAMLDDVAAGIDDANDAGGIGSARRTALGDELDGAQQLMLLHNVSDPALTDRVSRLRAALAALPALDDSSVTDPVTPADGGSSGDLSNQDTEDATGESDGDATDGSGSTATDRGDGSSDGSGDGTSGEDSTGTSDDGSSGDGSTSDGSGTSSDGTDTSGGSGTSGDSGGSDGGDTSGDGGSDATGFSDGGDAGTDASATLTSDGDDATAALVDD